MGPLPQFIIFEAMFVGVKSNVVAACDLYVHKTLIPLKKKTDLTTITTSKEEDSAIFVANF